MDLPGTPAAVTGAGGFIGAATCARLASEGADVVGLDLDPESAPRVEAAGARFVRCDVTDPRAVESALAGRALVVHTAATIADWGAMPHFVELNVRGTRNVLDAAGRHDAERVVHLSSVAIWGWEFGSDVHEDHPPRATGVPYIDTKAASDHLARQRGATVVRPGDVYGPRSVPWALRPLQALRSGRFAIPPEGLITPVYVDDLVDCIVRAATVPEAAGRSFVAWEGPPVPTREYFDRLARMVGRERAPVAPRPLLTALAGAEEMVGRLTGRPPTAARWVPGYLARRAAYDCPRAAEVLGWHAQVSLDEGMARTETWAREEGLLA
jgi:nucleoside-diphosphate-sugar epimerase